VASFYAHGRAKESRYYLRFFNGKPIARLGDVCDYGGKITQGTPWLTFE